MGRSASVNATRSPRKRLESARARLPTSSRALLADHPGVAIHSARLVEITRGPEVEAWHTGAVVAVDVNGQTLFELGDASVPVFIRSAVKPFVAALLVSSGAADALSLDDSDLAISSASHGGTDESADMVQRLLSKVGVDGEDLVSGPSEPTDPETKQRTTRLGVEQDPLRHECSGEHAGMLALCVHNGWPKEGYWKPDHPLQRELQNLVERVFRVDSSSGAIDDCSVPTWFIPLRSIALAYAWLASPDRLPSDLSDLCEAFTRVRDAMLAHPDAIGGPNVFDSDLIKLQAKFVAKEGAEGVLAIGSLSERIGIAQALDDGDKTRRATGIVGIAALERLSLLTKQESESLRETHWPSVSNSLGDQVGELRASF
jgi:L-asparaginase II